MTKTFYYKIFDSNNNFLGLINSIDFKYYNLKSKRILNCSEKDAQYACFNNQLYKVRWFNSEKKFFNFPEAKLKMATKEEYEEYMQKQEKEKLEQK